MRRRPRPVLAALALLTITADAGAQMAEGRQLYERHCAVCHGPKGDGNGEAATRLSTKPADLTAGRFKFRSTPSGALPTDQDLLHTLTRGVRGTAMIPQTHLSLAERQTIVAYLKRLSPRFAEPGPPAVGVPPAPAVRPDLLAAGARAYRASGCPECHGEGARGDGPSAWKGMKDARDLPIVPADLTRRPLKRGSAPEETWKSVALGLDGTPMPSYADALDPGQIWALVLFLESLVPPDRRHPEDRLLPGEEVLGDQIEGRHHGGH